MPNLKNDIIVTAYFTFFYFDSSCFAVAYRHGRVSIREAYEDHFSAMGARDVREVRRNVVLHG